MGCVASTRLCARPTKPRRLFCRRRSTAWCPTSSVPASAIVNSSSQVLALACSSAPVEQDMPGRFVKKGQLVGYVIDASDRLTARTMVGQNDIGLVRERTRGVDVIPVHWEGLSSRTSIIREVPEGLKALPTPALGTMGGGSIAIDPRDGKGVTALDRYFEYEVALPADDDRPFIGQRVQVRFDHGTEPIGFQVIPLIPPDLPEAVRCLKRRCCDLASPRAPIPSARTCGESWLDRTTSAAFGALYQRFGPNHLDRGFLRQVASGVRRTRIARRRINSLKWRVFCVAICTAMVCDPIW